jgi:hypothetical protein
MADDGYDPGANSTPFGPQAGDTPAAVAAPSYDPGAAAKPKENPNPLTTSYGKVPTSQWAGSPWETSPDQDEYGGKPGSLANVAGVFTGDTSVKRPEVPFLNMEGLKLGVTDPKAWGIVGNMALSRDPAALERAIQSRVPEAKFAGDGGERTVQVPGGPEMYLDRPGFTPQKGMFYVPQTLAALATRGKSLPAQMGLGGIQHALSQLGSYSLGGEASPVDPVGTAISTAAPGLLGAVGAGAIKGYEYLNSEVVPPAREAIKRLGAEGLSAADQAAASIADRARTLYRWGFAGKPGDILNDPVLVAKEDLAANAGPPGARRIMTEFHRTNAENVDVNKRQIIGEASGDVAPGTKAGPDYAPNESYFGDKINDAVTGRVKQLTDVEKKAWERLGDISPDTAAGRSVSFSPDVSTATLTSAADTIRRIYGTPQGPNGTWTAAQLGKSGQEAVEAFGQLRRVMMTPGKEGEPGAIREFNLGNLQDLRQHLGNVIKDNPGTSASVAATRMKQALDEAVTTAEGTPGHLVGDPASLSAFREANAATRARYKFMEPDNNPAAERVIKSIVHPETPATGQETASTLLGGGSPVTPSGGTNPVVMHLKGHLGDEFTQPAAGALSLRTLYGNRGTSATAETAPARYDYDSTSSRIGAQLGGKGVDVTNSVLPSSTQEQLASFQRALDILGVAGRRAGPRQNASGTGYVGMMTRELPFGLGPIADRLQATLAAKNAVQGGAELVNRAQAGANTAADLKIRLPRQSTIQNQDPQNPFYSWQPEAWRAGTPVYRGGGLLGAELLDPSQR